MATEKSQMKKIDEKLKDLFYNLKNPSALSTPKRLYDAANKKIPINLIKKWLRRQNAYTLHRESKKRFERTPYRADNIFLQHEIDLIELPKLAKYNDNYKYLLVNIDIFSRKLNVRPIKNKTSTAVRDAFKSIIEQDNNGRHPLYISSDRGLFK